MKRILVIGGGKSSPVLIDYLLKNAVENDWEIVVGDVSLEVATARVEVSERGTALQLDINDETGRKNAISSSDIVISMLPASLHYLVANDCIEFSKNLLTASYVSEGVERLHDEAVAKNLLFLNEIGLDPGIDHMTAMQGIDSIRKEGGKMIGFETFAGGLVAPESDNNPWHYKFTWNPRNVVLAGQGYVKFRHNGKFKYIPYNRLFKRTERIYIPGYGDFEGYANRDSLKYRALYGLDEIDTIYRGTLRRPGFCKAWDCFVQLGATDDSYEMEGCNEMTHRDFINSFLRFNPHDSVELKLAHYLNLDLDSDEMHMLQWLGVFDKEPIGLKNSTPAQILQHILEKKWSLQPEDKDMIVMWHLFDFELNGVKKQIQSSMGVIGDDSVRTAMAKTVGLPIAIATKLILQGKINVTGVRIPTIEEIYKPVLKELEQNGIQFEEREFILKD